MVAYSFKKQFVVPILSRTKGGTIRADRKRHARPGEVIQIYTGMRTKQCRMITELECRSAEPICLRFDKPEVFAAGRVLRSSRALDAFAVFDGFESFEQMRAFWSETPSVMNLGAFSGWHICWLPLPEALR